MRRIEIPGGDHWIELKDVDELTLDDQLVIKEMWGFTIELDKDGKGTLRDGQIVGPRKAHDITVAVYEMCITAWSYNGGVVAGGKVPLTAQAILDEALEPHRKALGYEGPAPDGPDGDPKATRHSSSNGTSRASARPRRG
jgi:hypothetical protein